ncbi:membrane protein [Alkalihalobacillus alcalophilus ATCC 27647 = CGMCC 1.3604]|uniref:Membrane protein n=1 Tax=Alkalihalobacillus alcalophilus ATCC 27647 = CGMCC 1.3604 TaxID=1218173 RepID=A0A4S4JUX6_ALKAL|nr:membrane protein [Alkalihalobacillus alcalophilus ATCC 27647 = CGMCC 1.3604]
MNYNAHHALNPSETHHIVELIASLYMVIPLILFFLFYLLSVYYSNKHYKNWPKYRTLSFASGLFLASVVLLNPVVPLVDGPFVTHMIHHLLLGMLVPLLIVLSAPMTLLFRILNVSVARKLSSFLKSWPFRVYTHPIIASALNIGGLWLLYTSNLYSLMHENDWINGLVHAHLFMAGYLFTVSMIYIDPIYHRVSFQCRALTLIIALAGHGILTKYIYANPPIGVEMEQAQQAAKLMYYGGDLIDAVIIFILCWQWFKATRPRIRMVANQMT